MTASKADMADTLTHREKDVAEIAAALRNHPSSTIDNGKLSGLADRLDGVGASLRETAEHLRYIPPEKSKKAPAKKK